MSYFHWKPYVPVAERRRKAARSLAGMKKTGAAVEPVIIEGRTIASSFWGKSWCSNLERYSDYESRLPRGRSYVRNGSVLDLKIGKGEVTSRVSGSELYTIKITIAPVKPAHWSGICHDCAGSIDSVVELLQGRLAKSVMDRVCRQGDGLFPAPGEIKLSCSCPDWATMCKHVAATLYGIGARLDARPELLFVLRGVDKLDLIAKAGTGMPSAKHGKGSAKVLADDDIGSVFGLDMAAADAAADAPPVKAPPLRTRKPAAGRKPTARKPTKTAPARAPVKSKPAAPPRAAKSTRVPAKPVVASAAQPGKRAKQLTGA